MTTAAPSFSWGVEAGLATAAFVAIAGPLVAAWLFRRRTGASWISFGLGALTFFVFQVVLRFPWQIPLALWLQPKVKGQPLAFAALIAFSALGAGVFEEVGRWVAFRYAVRERSWRQAVMLGLGHGGIESALLVGLNLGFAAVMYFLVARWRLTAIPLVPPAQLEAMRAQFAALTPGLTVVGVVERVLSITFHVGMSVVVLQSFARGGKRWLALAIALHTLTDFASVEAAQHLSPYATEGVIAIFAAIGLALTLAWRPRPSPGSAPTPP